MRTGTRTALAGVVWIGLSQVIGAASAHAQGPGSIGSLGGYGGSMTDSGSTSEMGGPAIPYAGKFGGFMPYRMGGGGSLSFQSRGASAMGSNRTSFSLSPMSGGMSSMSGGAGRTFGAVPSMSSSFGSQGTIGSGGGGGMPSMSGARGTGVMPPSFGYPFRQPPSLLSPSSSGAGMSM